MNKQIERDRDTKTQLYIIKKKRDEKQKHQSSE